MIHVCDKPTFSFCMTQQIFNKMKHRRNFKCHFILCYIRSEAAKPSHLQSRLRLLIFPKNCLFLPDLYHSVKTNVFFIKLKWQIQFRGEREFPFPTIFGNAGLRFPFPKFGNEFFIPVPKSWECFFRFPFPFPKFGNAIFHSRSRQRERIIMSGIKWEWSSKVGNKRAFN